MVKKDAKKSKAGRKNKYFSHVQPRLEEIKHWARDGLTDAEICERLKVSVASFCEYKKQYMELFEALKENKDFADNLVVDSLYMRAKGYEYEEITKEPVLRKDSKGNPVLDDEDKPIYDMVVTKIVKKNVVPDTTAQIFWLKNRQPDKWRDKQEIDMNAKIETIEIQLPEELK
jgi:hypothetical protein